MVPEFVWSGEGYYRRAEGSLAAVREIPIAKRIAGQPFVYYDASGVRYTATGGYLGDGVAHSTDLVGPRLEAFNE